MKSILIKINYHCNNNCIFCHEKKENSEITLEEFDKIIKNNNIKKVYLSGGEPTLNKNLFQILEKRLIWK